jgi:hypothetical protein
MLITVSEAINSLAVIEMLEKAPGDHSILYHTVSSGTTRAFSS